MPADAAIWLLGSYGSLLRRARELAPSAGGAGAGSSGDGTWRDLGGGRRAYQIKSMDTLYGLMQSRGGAL